MSIQVGDLFSIFHIIDDNSPTKYHLDTGVVVEINDDLCPTHMLYYSFEYGEVVEEFLEDHFQVEIIKKGAKA